MIMLMEFNRIRYKNVESWVNQIFDQGYQVTKLSHSAAHYKNLTMTDILDSDTSQHMMLAIKK